MDPVDQFRDAWTDVRRLTYELVDHVPESRWDASPHSRFAPFNKQLRHMVCVQGVYHQGFVERRADFAVKHSHYSGALTRRALRDALHRKDDELFAILESIRREGADAFSIDFFGKRRGFSRYCAILVQHEALHHGQWSFYAALGGFDTPAGWRVNWGL